MILNIFMILKNIDVLVIVIIHNDTYDNNYMNDIHVT